MLQIRSKNIKAAAIIGICFISAVLTIKQLKETEFLKNSYTAVSVRMNKVGITEQRLDQALKNERDRGATDVPDITAWNSLDQAKLINPVLQRSVLIMPIVVWGEMRQVAPMTIVYGNYVYREDKKGCVIDEDTAYQLFGTKQVDGNIVEYQNKKYLIRGVVRSKYPLFLLQGKNTETEYKNLELCYHQNERGEELAGEFMCQNALGSDYTTIDGYFYSRIIGMILSIPLWGGFLSAAAVGIRLYIQHGRKLMLFSYVMYGLCIIFIFASYGVILLKYGCSPIYIPDKLIPSKWSDFDYWTRQIKLIKDQLLVIRFLPPNPKDVILTDSFLRLPYQFIISITLYFMLLLKLVLFIKRNESTRIGINITSKIQKQLD